ncbi:MAG: hypothetical protein IKW66_01755, partial [Clostridia bacterium]|nr:hypothetical protein [Clostridia bacterium]
VSVMKNSKCGEAFAHLLARMPLPLGRIRKEPFSGKGFLAAAFLCYLSFAEAKESRKTEAKESRKI